ncbi:MAG: DUF6810 family protein [Chloroflexota bacterium]|nr:DUF6810 family protein [Chloroflexota bacterium]MEC9451535.1 DUF6810 family protein [Chloroflexota bacterium]MQG04240.1 hypothetical protein [SAR202 cluster bacterium]|tara:strand:+ start:7473 stop:7985 length:513 start_codon:yes stop_codon:yes gene_type:complete
MHLKNILLISIISMSLSLIACGDASSENGNSDDGGIVTSRIMNESSNHSISDFETAGLKKPKSIKADAVDKKTGERITPEATEVHVGFFKSSLGPKDIEVRFYPSHEDAKTYGVPPAEKTINAAVEAGGAVKGAGTFAKSSYGAYIVSGNAVMLCQVQIEVCDELAAGLK